MSRENDLASSNRVTKNIGVLAIVILELKLVDVEMKVLFADLVESPYDATLQDRSEAFEGLSMDRAVNVLVRRMVNDAHRVSCIRPDRRCREAKTCATPLH
jgi:hypothetical protein